MPARFYKLVQTSQRGYVLLSEQIELNVNSLVRIPEPITFAELVKARKVPSAPAKSSARLRAQAKPPAPPSAAPSKREKMRFLGEPKHNEILASLSVRL